MNKIVCGVYINITKPKDSGSHSMELKPMPKDLSMGLNLLD